MSELEKYYSKQAVACAYLGLYDLAKRYAVRARVASALGFCRELGANKEQTWLFIAVSIKYA